MKNIIKVDMRLNVIGSGEVTTYTMSVDADELRKRSAIERDDYLYALWRGWVEENIEGSWTYNGEKLNE